MDDQTSLKIGKVNSDISVNVETLVRAYVEGVIDVVNSGAGGNLSSFFRSLFGQIHDRVGVDLYDYPKICYSFRSYGQLNMDNNGISPFVNGAPHSIIEFYIPVRGDGYSVRLTKTAKEQGVGELVTGVLRDIGSNLERGLINSSSQVVNSSRSKRIAPKTPEIVENSLKPSVKKDYAVSASFREFLNSTGLVFSDYIAGYYQEHPDELNLHLERSGMKQ